MPRRLPIFSQYSLSWILLCGLVSLLCIAGGASQANAIGQALVRFGAALSLVAVALFGERPAFGGARPAAFILVAAILLVLLQLLPLPPTIWMRLPGRDVIVAADAVAGQAPAWRPLAIVPGATINAAFSLLIPVATLVLATGVSPAERQRVPGLVLCMILVSALVGVLQLAGTALTNPLVNAVRGEASGFFANRNHFALLLAQGCLVVSFWAFAGRRGRWRVPVGIGLELVLLLVILGSGSRAGMLLGAMAFLIAIILAWRNIRAEFSGAPAWLPPAAIAASVGIIASVLLASVVAGRAVSIDRVLALDASQDVRQRSLPTVIDMIGTYFPFGSGIGGFDPVFRLHEPFALLKPTYFNHAHNDFLEVVLDAGLPGLALLVVALGWWGWASVRAWRAGSGSRYMLPKLGSATLLLLIVASLFDYPARTPIMMAIMTIAAVWLSQAGHDRHSSALPGRDQHL